MKKKLSIRLDAEQQRQLRQTAKILGKSMSELVREILEQALAERPIAAKAAHVKGSLNLIPSSRNAWSRKLKERNWRH
jgi:plasmid stability protein